jgi:homogentisate phytyltransferase/homogentisate geranylgeranyltransferase
MLRTLWDFGRPHTIIASFISITTLYLLVVPNGQGTQYISIYLLTLISALACNVFITGLNQITDVDLDKKNKAFLPIPRGDLSIAHAKIIIVVSFVLCLISAAIISHILFLIMLLIAGIGFAYSAPPLRLKRHHLPAALSIVVVRGIVVNLGIGWFLEWKISGSWGHLDGIILLAIFVSAYSFAIAWFKDLYDLEGDEAFKIKTFPVLYSIHSAFTFGSTLVILAYLSSMFYTWYFKVPEKDFLIGSHAVLLLAFIVHIIRANLNTRPGIYRFYMRFWVFFFAEYLLFLLYGILF